MVDRVVVGAHYGLRDWLIQRISAVLMALCSVALVVYLLLQPRLDYDIWTALFSSQVIRALSLMFMISLLYHAWIGVRDVVMDYVKPASARLVFHAGDPGLLFYDLVGSDIVGF